jgi:hypothetical protein
MVKTMGEVMQPFKEGMNKPAYQLYMLFLCSRDIQVGDKTINSNTGKEEEYTEYLKTYFKTATSNPHFKVIGEISPEAVWVKEGDEFDEYQMGYWGTNNREVDTREFGFEGYIPYCKIKCPTCKIFH